MKIPTEAMNEAAELARLCFDPEILAGGGAVLVWRDRAEHHEALAYRLEGWAGEGWLATDTHSPAEVFAAGNVADARLTKRFTWFLLGSRGAISPGETLDDEARRFAAFEAAGGTFGKYGLMTVQGKEVLS